MKKHVARHDSGILIPENEDELLLYNHSDDLESNSDVTPKKQRIKKPRPPKLASLSRETKVALAKEDDGLDDIVIKAEQHDPGSKLPYFCDKCNHVYGRFETIQGLKTHMKYCTGS